MKKIHSVALLFFLAIYSCSGNVAFNHGIFAYRANERISFRSLAILPFTEKNLIPKGSHYAECALTGLVAVSGETIPGSGITLSGMIWSEMNSSKNIENLINWDISESEFREVLSEKKLVYSLETAVYAGKQMGVDAVIVGTILRYNDREGNALAVKRPASVAFTFVLLDVRSGAILLEAKFDKDQKPLSENLFELFSFIKGGMKWQSAEELSLEGIKKLVLDLSLRLHHKQVKGGAEGRT